jgi:hypothetical protein
VGRVKTGRSAAEPDALHVNLKLAPQAKGEAVNPDVEYVEQPAPRKLIW